MRKKIFLTAATVCSTAAAVWAACGYFGPNGPDRVGMVRIPPVTQPSQRAFITWDEEKRLESFTVQPEFQGNAKDFGMVIPTPARPKLQEMPKDFFRALTTFTTLAPLDISKFRIPPPAPSMSEASMRTSKAQGMPPAPRVTILERGIVGSLDYKILEADTSEVLFTWLREHRYSYRGQEAVINEYVKKHWLFTVMKIDSRNMKKRPDGGYLGEVTPSRFTFTVNQPIYPLRITQGSVIQNTDVQLFVLAHKKMDLQGDWSYANNFWWMWQRSMAMAYPEKLTAQERHWIPFVKQGNPQIAASGSRLEWAGKMTPERLASLAGNRKVLAGHLKPGWTLTRIRKRFQKSEMTHDINLVPANYKGREDDMEYVATLPVSLPGFGMEAVQISPAISPARPDRY